MGFFFSLNWRSQVVLVITFLAVTGITGQLLMAPTDTGACSNSYSMRSQQRCEERQALYHHPGFALELLATIFVGGAAAIALNGGFDRKRRSSSRSGSRRSTHRAPAANDTARHVIASPAPSAFSPAGAELGITSDLPAYLRPSVPEIELAAAIADATGHTWWVDHPPTDGMSRIDVSWDAPVAMRLLVGREGEWTADLGTHPRSFATSVAVPSPRACICLIPAGPVSSPIPVTARVDLPGEVLGAREYTG